MAVFHFTGEIICELTGQYLDFELEYDVYEDPDMTREELVQMGQDYASFPSPDLLLSTILRNCQKALDKDFDQEYAGNLLEGIAYDFVGLYAHMTMGNVPDDWS